jgi:hypothetical protein
MATSHIKIKLSLFSKLSKELGNPDSSIQDAIMALICSHWNMLSTPKHLFQVFSDVMAELDKYILNHSVLSITPEKSKIMSIIALNDITDNYSKLSYKSYMTLLLFTCNELANRYPRVNYSDKEFMNESPGALINKILITKGVMQTDNSKQMLDIPFINYFKYILIICSTTAYYVRESGMDINPEVARVLLMAGVVFEELPHFNSMLEKLSKSGEVDDTVYSQAKEFSTMISELKTDILDEIPEFMIYLEVSREVLKNEINSKQINDNDFE